MDKIVLNKKVAIALSLVLLGVSGSTFADGFYAGLAGAYSAANLKNNITVNYDLPPPANTPSTFSDTSHGNNGIFGGYVGYGKIFDQQFYLGLEGNALFGTTSISTTFNRIGFSSGQIKEKIQNVYGLTIMPGYAIIPSFLVYGKLGVADSKFSFNAQNPAYFGTAGNFNKNLIGGQIGLGGEVSINYNWRVRAEYDYIDYQNFNRTAPAPEFSNSNVRSRYDLNQQLVMVGVTYDFGQPTIVEYAQGNSYED